MRKYVYIPILLIIIIIIIILIIRNNRYTSSRKYSYYYTKRIYNIQRELFETNNIYNDNRYWNIYLPNGYNNIELELKMINTESYGKNKFIFGINGCDWIVSKNGLWHLLEKKYSREQARYIMPETYILNNKKDINLIKRNFHGQNFIMKKNIQRKNGIKITNNINEIIEGFKNDYKIVQRYVENVFLVNRRKLNIRVYILVVYNKSVKFYIHKDSKCIYTNKDYNNDITDFETNITSYKMDYIIYENNPFSIEELNYYIYKNHGNNIDLFIKIKELMTLVGRACLTSIKKSSNIRKATTYQLFGADVILDNNFIPYLLEINKGPDMKIRCDRDKILKEKVYRDIYDTLGIIKEDNNRFIMLNI